MLEEGITPAYCKEAIIAIMHKKGYATDLANCNQYVFLVMLLRYFALTAFLNFEGTSDRTFSKPWRQVLSGMNLKIPFISGYRTC